MKKLNNVLEEVVIKENWDEEVLKEIEEAITTSMQMRSREAKINAATAAIAVKIGLQKHDPAAEKMIKFRRLWKQYKDEVVKKYGPIAYQKYIQNQAKK